MNRRCDATLSAGNKKKDDVHGRISEITRPAPSRSPFSYCHDSLYDYNVLLVDHGYGGTVPIVSLQCVRAYGYRKQRESARLAHDHNLCVLMTATTIKYTAAILPMVGSTKSHPTNALGVSDIANARIARRSKVGLMS